MDSREAFAQVLRDKRAKKNLSQEELAALAGRSMRFISLLECNKQQATISTIDVLASALDISKTEIIRSVEKLEKDSKTPLPPALAKHQGFLDGLDCFSLHLLRKLQKSMPEADFEVLMNKLPAYLRPFRGSATILKRIQMLADHIPEDRSRKQALTEKAAAQKVS